MFNKIYPKNNFHFGGQENNYILSVLAGIIHLLKNNHKGVKSSLHNLALV